MSDETAMSEKRSDSYWELAALVLAVVCGSLLLVVWYGGDLSELFGQTPRQRRGFLAGLGTALVCAVIAHIRIRGPLKATVIAAMCNALVMVLVLSFLAGRVDPFAPIACVTGFLLGLAVAAPVGIVFFVCRKLFQRDE